MTPRQLARQEDIRAQREMFRRLEQRRTTIWRVVLYRLPQLCFWIAALFVLGWMTWNAIDGVGPGMFR